MKIDFFKFHGNGNDFVLIDNLTKSVMLTAGQIAGICHRQFGVGADGLIEINPSSEVDFAMKYYNADGLEGTMCGNGGRCAAAFAYFKGYAPEKMRVEAVDGFHQAEIERITEVGSAWYVALQLNDVTEIKPVDMGFYLDTGSPHIVVFADGVKQLNVYEEGKKIRESDAFSPDGVNVNFVEVVQETLFVRTFERGVEDETLSCGTGVSAAAIAAGHVFEKNEWQVKTPGGDFLIHFKRQESAVREVWLHGPAVLVFGGSLTIN